MSILITGIDMPTKGNPITVLIYPDGTAEWEAQNQEGTAIPVPPHGRLIDADELHSVLRKRAKEFSASEYGEGVKCGLADAREYIKIAPTIIPAEEGE